MVSNNGTGTATIYGDTQFGGHTGTIALNRATTFEIPNTGTGDWWYSFGSGGISGAGPVTIKGGVGGTSAAAGGNRIMFSGNNNYSGGTTIQSGMLQLNAATSAGTGSITLGNASTGTAVTQLRVGANIANNIIVSSAAPNSPAGIATYNSLQTLSGGLQVDRPLTIHGASDRLTWSGAGAIWSGSGDITISGGRVTHDTAVNTWTGNMTINPSSIFQIGNPGSALANASSVTANGALRLALSPGGSATIPRLNGAATGTVFADSGGAGAGTRTLLVGAGNGTGAFFGVVGPGTAGGEVLAVTKIGTGTQAFNGANTYTGTTNVNAGTYNVASGARLGGDGTISLAAGNSVNIAGTPGDISPGAAALPYSPPSPPSGYSGHAFDATYTAGQDVNTVGQFTVNGNTNIDGFLLIDLFSASQADKLDVNGTLTLNNASFDPRMEINGVTNLSLIDFFDLGFDVGTRVNLVEFNTKSGVFENFAENTMITDAGGHQIFLGNDGSNLFLLMTPEPQSVAIWSLLGLGIAALAWANRRRIHV